MNSLLLIVATILISSAHAQFEAGHVKILEDQRYQDGAVFGNFRNQEDGIQYKEETNPQGIRTGFWQYPDETGKIVRVEFEAGPGIGFRIVNSNVADTTPITKKSPSPAPQQQRVPVVQAPVFRAPPQAQPRPAPRQQPQAQHTPRVQPVQLPVRQQFVQQPLPVRQPFVQQQVRQPFVQQPLPVVQPEPVNIFDYPAELQFTRSAGGHRFRFTAV